MNDTTIKVTKLDAAQRQLRTAIRLWFTGGDPVAIHTLAAASHELIHTLFRRAGHSDLFFDTVHVREERRGEFAKLMKAPATFFKHAQHDADGQLNFNPSLNEVLITYSTTGLRRMGVAVGMEELIFGHWLALHHPDWMVKGHRYDSLDPKTLEDFRSIGKHDFFEAQANAWHQRRRA